MDVPNHDAGDGITETVDRSNVPDGETAGAASASALKGAKKRKQRLLSMTVTPSVPTLVSQLPGVVGGCAGISVPVRCSVHFHPVRPGVTGGRP